MALLCPTALAAVSSLSGEAYAQQPSTPFDPPPPAAGPAQPGWGAPTAPPAAPPGPGAPPGTFAPAPDTAPPGAPPTFGFDARFDAQLDHRPPAAAVDEHEERARTLAEHSGLNGSTGLLRTAYAGSGAAGTFRVGFLMDWFTTSGFLCNSDTPCDTLGTEDEASHIGGWFTLNATPLSFLEAYAGIRTYANSNSLGSPTLLQVLGDTTLGVKAFTPFRVADMLTFGGDIRLLLLNGAGDVGPAGSGTSAEFTALTSLDLREIRGKGVGAPVRVHLNVGYRLDNSGNLVEDVERLRAQRNPDVSRGLERIPVSRIERFGLGINRVDFVQLRLGADVPLRWVQPYAEYTVDVPVNRQGYECHTRTISPGDVCLALQDLQVPTSGPPGYSAAPSRLTLGARATPFGGGFRGLSGHVAFDIGLSGTSTFIEEVAPQAPWTLYLGLGYAFDTQEKEVPLPPPPPPPPPPEVIPPPPQYFVRGVVKEAGTETVVANAIINVQGSGEPPYATDASGRFLTRDVEPGSHTFAITADGYKPGTCTATVQHAASPEPEPSLHPAPPGFPPQPGFPPAPPVAPQPASPPTGDFFTDIECEIEALPRKGGVAGAVIDSESSAGVAGVQVEITDSSGASHHVTTGPDGKFQLADLPPGPVKLKVEHEQYLLHVAEATVRPREDAPVSLSVTKRPRQASARITGNEIRIMRQVHFETDSAVIKGDSFQLLAEVADLMNRNPNVLKIEVQGHTDNTGPAQRNEELSQQRAEAVRKFLIDHGIDGSRLTAKGYGQSRPLVPNVTPANRARNRRVQFVIIEKE